MPGSLPLGLPDGLAFYAVHGMQLSEKLLLLDTSDA
jgi:hypothetical protein